ncbi:MAG: hypothetical protein R3D31_17585 [Hyphomicrobiaceae bacterium]
MKWFALGLAALIGIVFATPDAEARRYKGERTIEGRKATHKRTYRTRTTRLRKVRRSYRSTRAHRRQHYRSRASHRRYARPDGYRRAYTRTARYTRTSRREGTLRLTSLGRHSGVGARPRKWCGWWMRTQLGGGPEFNVAWNWRKYGSPTGPQVGAVVVWRHHVGIITGQASNGRWIVKSGNDGGRVRERARSVAGAVFRI